MAPFSTAASRHSRALAAVSGFGLQAEKNASPSRLCDVPGGRKARALSFRDRFVQQDSARPATSASAAAVLGFSRTGEIV